MPAIISAKWRVSFKKNSLTDNHTYWQEFSIVYGEKPVIDFVSELKSKGYVEIIKQFIVQLI